MIRKELNSQNQYEAGLALTSLSCYISTDLARDLSNDILTLVRNRCTPNKKCIKICFNSLA